MKQKFKLSFEGIDTAINNVKAKIKGLGNAVNSTFSGMKTSNLNNQLKNTEQYSKQSINSIMRSLKELRTELNKAGQYNKSNAVKEFSKNFMREQGKIMIDDRRDSINKSLEKIGDTEVSSKWIKSFDKAINTAEKKSTRISKMGDNIVVGLNKALTLTAIAYGMKKLAQGVGYVTEEYISLVESNNLFQVSMKAVADEYGNIDMASSTYYRRAIDFQKQMSEKLGANKKELQNYQAIYMNMFSGQGISNDISYRLSESLTKAGYDLASLYNKDIKTTMENLQSGISGQPEGLRKNFGIDISEGTLKGILGDLGIERSIDQLSYAEKEVARYIAILRQAGNAQGDFAKTIDSPANQLKMLKNQFTELAQVAGSFVVNWFGGLIVYVNAVIMAVKQVLIYFATLFGYDLNFGGATSSMRDTSDAIGGIGSGLSDASGKAKELKKELMGFDEINNIEKPSDSSGGGGGGGASGAGIDSKLLEALDDWDNKMESIQGKAQKLRDDMLAWLGFERNDDGTWKLKEGYTNFEKIKDVVKAIGVAMGTWTVAKTVTNVLNKLGLLSTTGAYKLTFGLTLGLTGIYLAYKGVSHLINGDIDLFSILETVGGTTAGAFGLATALRATKLGKTLSFGQSIMIGFGIMLTLEGLVASYNGVKKALDGDATLGDLLAIGGGTLATGLGIATIIKQMGLGQALYWKEALVIGLSVSFAITGLEGLYAIFKDISKGSKEVSDSIGEIAISAGTTLASCTVLGAQIGTIFGNPLLGAGIGAITGLLTSGASALMAYANSAKESFSNIGKGASDFIEGIAKAESHLNSFNSTLFASTQEQQKLQANMDEIQQAITDICKRASDERRNLTDEEIQKLDEYFAQLRELKNREIEIQSQIAQAITQQAETNAEVFQGSLDEYKQQSQEWIKTAEEQSAKTIEIIKEGSIEEVALLNQKYGDQATMQNEAYAKEYNEIIKQRDEKIQQAQNEVTKVNEAYANGYLERSKTNEGFYNVLEEYNKRMEEENQKHNEKMQEIQEKYGDFENVYRHQKEANDSLHEKAMKKIWNEMYRNMSEEQANELGVWLALVSQTEMYGGQIDNKTQTLVDNIIKSYDNMPKETREAMKNAMQPMLEEMEKKEPSLFKKATGIADGILTRLKKSFDIHSPSKKTREIFKNLMLGAELGIDDEENNIYNQTNNVAEKVLNKLDLSKSLKKLNSGIKINTKDFSVDTNQYVDYGAISGNITAQSQVQVNDNIIKGIAMAVANAVKDINVNIEAKTEEGVIVKKATEGIKDFVNQTGELPFPIPV